MPNCLLAWNVVSVTAAGGLLLFMVTSFVCLTVSIILIRRERKKGISPNCILRRYDFIRDVSHLVQLQL